jgi:hypothetical protein
MCWRQVDVFVRRDTFLETTSMARPYLPFSRDSFDGDATAIDVCVFDQRAAKAARTIELDFDHRSLAVQRLELSGFGPPRS